MLTSRREQQLAELESKLGLSFVNKTLLSQAFTHSSYAHESTDKIFDNERLEFLGDAVIKLVISEYLYNKYPASQEGDMTKIRAVAISDEIFFDVAKRLKLGEYLLLGANEKRTGGAERKSNVANVFEAFIGALYLDAGLGKSRDILLGLLVPEIEKISKTDYMKDYKSALQEYVQKKKWGLPSYHVIKESGPKHKKMFSIEVMIKGQSHGVGQGHNKKEGEQAAAKVALLRFVKPQGKIKNFISNIKKKITKTK
jgi:ribonuclease III